MFLKQSTSQSVRFGPFVDSTDGATAETGLTINQADMRLSKAGGAFAQKSAAGAASHDSNGWYSTTLNATDTDTVGELFLQINVTGALPVWVRWYVLEEAIYDAIFGSPATVAEPSAVPAASSNIVDKIAWLFALSRNRIEQTDSTQSLKDDAGTTDIATASVSDNGTTFTRNEWS